VNASILIRTKNEARHLRACLEAVFSQEDAGFEVIVLDSGSTDATCDIARRFPVWLMTMRPEDFTYGYALNLGFGAARHPVLVALSGHSIPLHRRWLAALLRHFEAPDVVGVSGPEVNRWAPRLAAPVTLTRETVAAHRGPGFSNFNAALRRDVWARLPFHERLPYGEDKEWAWQALAATGGRIVIDPAVAVHHEHRESLRTMWRRGFREASAQAAWRGPVPYSRRTVAHLALADAWRNARRGRWDAAGLLGGVAYYHGRYAGFTTARRRPAPAGARLLDRPRALPKTSCVATP
jgi:rhamnosyltransferase